MEGNEKEGPEQMKQIGNNVPVKPPKDYFIHNKEITGLYQFVKITSQCASFAFWRRNADFEF